MRQQQHHFVPFHMYKKGISEVALIYHLFCRVLVLIEYGLKY